MVVLVEKHSGLTFERRPKVRAATAKEWREIVKRECRLESPREVLETSIRMLGLYLTATDEVVLSPLVVAPLIQEVLADAPRHVREGIAHQKVTVAHELVHALQEQHFALPTRLAGIDDKDHEEIRRLKTVIEGHAVLVEELIAEQELGLEDFLQRGPYGGIGADPSYLTGRRYFLHLLRTGGMKVVREALANPPTLAALLELANKELPSPRREPTDGGTRR